MQCVRVEGLPTGEGGGDDDNAEGAGRDVDDGLVLTGLPFEGRGSGGKGCLESGSWSHVFISFLALSFFCE